MKNILITGGTGGLGEVLCYAFSKKPARIGIHLFKNHPKGKTLLNTLSKKGNEVILFSGDLSNAVLAKKVFEQLYDAWGGIDLLINNAAINQDRLFHQITTEEWDQQIYLNLSGAYYCIREAANLMKKKEKGHIINIASLSALTGRAGQSAYTASKNGLIALSKTAAKELGKYGIQVNTVCPGFLKTNMTATLSTEQTDHLTSQNTLGRPSSLEEVSEFIRMLSEMKHISGQVFNLDSRI